tara:strand:- start:158 stop:388 length:231 start_codon:yes stop_codon:yes gene_type:complete
MFKLGPVPVSKGLICKELVPPVDLRACCPVPVFFFLEGAATVLAVCSGIGAVGLGGGNGLGLGGPPIHIVNSPKQC